MFRVKKIFRLPMGHRLSKHLGLCNNVHGHNMKIEVQISCHDLDNNDMVIDFAILQNIIDMHTKVYDHCTLLNSTDTDYINFLRERGRINTFENADPTAEMLAYKFYNIFSKGMKDVNQYINVDFVAIWESDDSVAIYDGCEKDVK
jgi:6-pyruvoyltetrahydropterin/6-carboxytetrahydropterin synthase